jgi:hypothetical protein
MKQDSSCLLALGFALALASTGGPRTAAADARGPEARGSERAQNSAEARGSELAWDCVPTYWWGYWTWAWQPCAWIDRGYVHGTIGAVAEAQPAFGSGP